MRSEQIVVGQHLERCQQLRVALTQPPQQCTR